jgi:anti-sigma factor RsiW
MDTPDPQPLTCAELVELITAYLDGALPAAAHARFDQHLAGCSGCRAYLEQMRLTIRTVGGLTPEAIPAPARTRLLETFRAWKAAR